MLIREVDHIALPYAEGAALTPHAPGERLSVQGLADHSGEAGGVAVRRWPDIQVQDLPNEGLIIPGRGFRQTLRERGAGQLVGGLAGRARDDSGRQPGRRLLRSGREETFRLEPLRRVRYLERLLAV